MKTPQQYGLDPLDFDTMWDGSLMDPQTCTIIYSPINGLMVGERYLKNHLKLKQC